MRAFKTILIFGLGLILWKIPPPVGIEVATWHLFGVFVSTIIAIILQPYPIGAIALTASLVLVLSKTLTFQQTYADFSHEIIWLIVFAFFIARGFIKTGLGPRIGFLFMKLLGKSSLGLGYGFAFTDLLLAPAIPSITARAGGVIFPVIDSLSRALGSQPHSKSSRKIGGYLTQVVFHSTCITGAMFLTAMAANPLIVQFGLDQGIETSWMMWAQAAFFPGFVNLMLLPLFVYLIYPPDMKQTDEASSFLQEKFREMGPMKRSEWIMLSTFIVLITLWMVGPYLGVKATVVALLGLVILLLMSVLSWDDILSEKGAWETLIWFSLLLMMAEQLHKQGMTTWFGDIVTSQIGGLNWTIGFPLLALAYYYSHYLFASNIAHIGAMFSPFLIVALSIGTPPLVAFYSLAVISSLYGGLTQYGCGPAAILFGAGYVPITTWWRVGFLVSLLNLLVWGVVGGLYWKFLGFF